MTEVQIDPKPALKEFSREFDITCRTKFSGGLYKFVHDWFLYDVTIEEETLLDKTTFVEVSTWYCRRCRTVIRERR